MQFWAQTQRSKLFVTKDCVATASIPYPPVAALDWFGFIPGLIHDGGADTSITAIQNTWSVEAIFDTDGDNAQSSKTLMDFEDETTHATQFTALFRDATLDSDTRLRVICYLCVTIIICYEQHVLCHHNHLLRVEHEVFRITELLNY